MSKRRQSLLRKWNVLSLIRRLFRRKFSLMKAAKPDVAKPSPLLGELGEVVEFVESIGISARRTRLGAYLQLLNSPNMNEKIWDIKEAEEFVLLQREIHELMWVCRALRITCPPGAADRFRTALGGRLTTRGDGDDRSARNALFELRIASYFIKAGFDVDLSTAADIVVMLESADVLIECKRIRSYAQAHKRMKDAAKQIKRGYSYQRPSTRRCYGLVALDVSQIINPKQGVIIGQSRDVACEGLRTSLRQCIDELEVAEAFRGDRRFLSIWAQCLTPVVHSEEGEATTRFSSIHTKMCSPESRAGKIFESLKPAFEHIDRLDYNDKGAGGDIDKWHLNQMMKVAANPNGYKTLPPLKDRFREARRGKKSGSLLSRFRGTIVLLRLWLRFFISVRKRRRSSAPTKAALSPAPPAKKSP